jgi:hypothetical protein
MPITRLGNTSHGFRPAHPPRGPTPRCGRPARFVVVQTMTAAGSNPASWAFFLRSRVYSFPGASKRLADWIDARFRRAVDDAGHRAKALMTTLMELHTAVDVAMRRGESFSAVEDEIIEPSRLSDEAKSALWLYAWSFVNWRAQRREAYAHIAQLARGPLPGQWSRSARSRAAQRRRRLDEPSSPSGGASGDLRRINFGAPRSGSDAPTEPRGKGGSL